MWWQSPHQYKGPGLEVCILGYFPHPKPQFPMDWTRLGSGKPGNWVRLVLDEDFDYFFLVGEVGRGVWVESLPIKEGHGGTKPPN